VGLGDNAGTAITEGSSNVCIGYNAGDTITNGSNNVAVGTDAGGAGICHQNVFIGSGAGGGATGNKDNNVAIGYLALANATADDTDGNVAIGAYSMTDAAAAAADSNAAVGYGALRRITDGDHNSGFGYGAGENVTTGENITCLGWRAGTSSSPSGEITSGTNTICLGDTGVSAVYVETDAWTTSDIRDKADVADFNGGLDWINAMQPISYVWDKRAWYCEESEDEDGNPVPITPQDILDAEPDGTHKKSSVEVGFSAQAILELEQSLGYGSSNDTSLLVDLTHDGTKYSLKRSHMIPMMVNAIQELSAEVNTLQAQISGSSNFSTLKTAVTGT
jgi:hypothetical protein